MSVLLQACESNTGMVSTGTTPRLLFEDRVDCVLSIIVVVVICPLFLFTFHILTLRHYIFCIRLFLCSYPFKG
jgi:hypothetical protein